ncbi:uncharacterized protein EHS24_002451 [Apiotrichum porosum]|uniref:Uncharacterized protein n=1 Tax=Apiotrichum porosum TaxID=105984 RepID=A0A427XGH9_9TREE|nr:uncharacterized protein EHS24_002451 [Apiotrichum porosum]RSH78000.1 hypothetical protein EHS24_002451 [Apiotrichum porosum]
MLFPTSSLVAILAAAAGASAQSASSSTASAAEISSTSVPDNNITSPPVTLPLKNAPSFSQPNSKTWWTLEDSAVSGVSNTLSWNWGKDQANGALGVVWLVLANTNKTLLPSDRGLIGTEDANAKGEPKVTFQLPLLSSDYAAAKDYTIKMVRATNWSMVFAESQPFEIKATGSKVASGASTHAGVVAGVCAGLMVAAAMAI